MQISSLYLDLASLGVVRDRLKAAIEQRVRRVKDVELTIDDDQLLIWIKAVDFGRFVPNFDLGVGVQARLASFDKEVLVINTRVYKLGIIPPCHLTHKSATWAEICVTRAKLAKICVKFLLDFRFRLALRRALRRRAKVLCRPLAYD